MKNSLVSNNPSTRWSLDAPRTWMRLYGVALVMLSLWMVGGCAGGEVSTDSESSASPALSFEESAAALGLNYRHFNGADGSLYFNEVVGPGMALFDADGDGDLDLYLSQGHELPARRKPISSADSHRLFVNQMCSPDEDCSPTDLRFIDETEESGLGAAGYGMGVAVGDANGDGLPDLFVANYGPNQLWLNQGKGKFRVSQGDPQLAGDAWSSSALFFDFENDGDDDLYVTNYVSYDVLAPRGCADSATGRPDYCGPQGFEAELDQIFVQRDGSLYDASQRLGIDTAFGKGLGVVELDADGDGASDLFVANDLMENFLWLWRDGRFVESGAISGLAFNSLGRVEASMGIAVGDMDSDGLEDLLSAHLEGETNTLYRNLGSGIFTDASQASRIGAPSMRFTAFGTSFADFDLDGFLDVVVANGAVTIYNDQTRPATARALEQPNQMFLGDGKGSFEEVTQDMGEGFAASYVSRGLATGDLDNDGDLDVLVSNNGGPLQVLINRLQERRPTQWIGLELVRSNGAASLGATVRRLRNGQPVGPSYRIRRADSFLSSKDPRLLFPAEEPPSFEVTWRSGRSQVVEGLERNRYHLVVEPTDNE